jgi:hypothetical protein
MRKVEVIAAQRVLHPFGHTYQGWPADVHIVIGVRLQALSKPGVDQRVTGKPLDTNRPRRG